MDSICHWSFIWNHFNSIHNKLVIYHHWLCWIDSFCCCYNWSRLFTCRWCFRSSQGFFCKIDIINYTVCHTFQEAPFWIYLENFAKEASLITNVVIFAIFVSCIYGCATNFSNEFTNMSLSYIYLTQARVKWPGQQYRRLYGNRSRSDNPFVRFTLIKAGNSIGVSTLPAITGALVKDQPVWMPWMVFICSVGCVLFEFLIWRQGLVVQAKFADSHKENISINGSENEAFEKQENKTDEKSELWYH